MFSDKLDLGSEFFSNQNPSTKVTEPGSSMFLSVRYLVPFPATYNTLKESNMHSLRDKTMSSNHNM